ncbi:Pentatricopeptide repeat-containing protein [Vitis vinifera]|uniref:Pentatricopeptide repeat-containing protein n=1 Tax=Vitis vinifera TaxID=29760 RepID=A0A438EDS1_VITVI|nr:Pentatricopeptide repeat-containing protein [Vitis vinifera]
MGNGSMEKKKKHLSISGGRSVSRRAELAREKSCQAWKSLRQNLGFNGLAGSNSTSSDRSTRGKGNEPGSIKGYSHVEEDLEDNEDKDNGYGPTRWVHSYIENNGVQFNVYDGTALADMYARFECTKEARRVFNKMQERDVISWSTNHMLVEKGLNCFNTMDKEYGVCPKVEHYGCVVDFLSRSGELDKAEDMIYLMPIKPNVIIWGALLGRSLGKKKTGSLSFMDK